MSAVFYRQAFTELAVTLEALEPLGLLDTAYIEDPDGVDGQVRLTLPGGGVRDVLVTGLDNAHERFRAFLDLATLPDGAHVLSGRARDVAGNVAEFALGFEVRTGDGVAVRLPGLGLAGLRDLSAPLGRVPGAAPLGPLATPQRALGAVGTPGAPLGRVGATWQTM